LVLLSLPSILFRPTFFYPLSFEDFEINYIIGKYSGSQILGAYLSSVTAFKLYYRPTGDLLAWLILKVTGPWEFWQHVAYYLLHWLTGCGIFVLVRRLFGGVAFGFWAAFLFMIAPVETIYHLASSTFVSDRAVGLFCVWTLVAA